jgi:hypothetical protein
MKILKFTFVLCLLAVISYGQKEPHKKIKPKRTDNYIRMKGIRIGADLTRPFQDLWTKGNRYGTEFSADMELWPNLFPVFESGLDFMKLNTDYVNYKSSGSYSRIGIDYNILQAENTNDKNIFYLGMRYGFSLAKQQVNSYKIDSYWQPETGSFGSQNYGAHWAEFLIGMKGEIIKNIYMGWTLRGKILVSKKDLGMPPVFFVPGYGKATHGFNADFSYSIFYNLPWDFRKSIDRKKAAVNEAKAKTTEKQKSGGTKPANKK